MSIKQKWFDLERNVDSLYVEERNDPFTRVRTKYSEKSFRPRQDVYINRHKVAVKVPIIDYENPFEYVKDKVKRGEAEKEKMIVS